MFRKGLQCKYEKLGEKRAAKATRRSWLKKLNGRVKGLKLSRSRKKLNWKQLSSVTFVLSRKVREICGGFVERLKTEEACPCIVLSCQWGLPVLSHSSVKSTSTWIS